MNPDIPELTLLSQHDYKANKEHKCDAVVCHYNGGLIKPGDRYRRFVYEDYEGNFVTEKIHLACLYDNQVS